MKQAVETWANVEAGVTLPARREVFLVGDVDDDRARQVMMGLRALDDGSGKEIRLIIASDGGEDQGGWAIYDTIKSMGCPVRGEVAGACMSIATLVLQACGDRVSSSRARFLLHNGSCGVEGQHDVARSAMVEMVAITNLYHEALAERSGMSLKKVKRLCREETYMSAARALQEGLIDGILNDKKVGSDG